MAKQKFLNNFEWQFIAPVKSSPSTGTPATELGYGILQISTGAASVLTNPTGGDWYVLTGLKRSGSVESSIEIIQVLGVDEAGYVAGGECRIRVNRGHDGSVVQAYVAGDYISMRLTKAGAEQFLQVQDNLASIGSAATARTNLALGNVDNTSDANKPVSTAQATALALKADNSAKDATGGYAGLTLYKVNMRNVANTFTSFLTNGNTAARTYTFPDKDLTVAGLVDFAAPPPIGNTTPGTVAGTVIAATSDSTGAILSARNTVAGAGKYTRFSLGNDTSANIAELYTFSSTYTETASEKRGGFSVYSAGGAGLSLVSQSGNVRVFAGSLVTQTALFSSTGLTVAGAVTSTSPVVSGYATGAGGTVTQATSKATLVTLNKPTGQITMDSASLAATTTVSFVVSNTLVAAADSIVLNLNFNNTNYQAWVYRVLAGSFEVALRNISGGALAEAVVLNFAVIKGATS